MVTRCSYVSIHAHTVGMVIRVRHHLFESGSKAIKTKHIDRRIKKQIHRRRKTEMTDTTRNKSITSKAMQYWQDIVTRICCYTWVELIYPSKLIERVVADRFCEHLTTFNLPAQQSAYRSFHSTETALLSVHNDLVRSVDSDKVFLLVLLDLSAAFDTVDGGPSDTPNDSI